MNDYDIRHQLDKLQEQQQEMLVQLTTTATQVNMMCEKINNLIDTGTPRCATNTTNIKGVKSHIAGIYTWLTGITLAVLGALLNHVFGSGK